MGYAYAAYYVMAAATAYSASEQAKSGRAQQRAYRAEQQKAEIENVRKARQSVREARIAQAQIQSQAALTGGVGGSAAAGGMASVQSQLGGNLLYMSQIAEQNTASSEAQMQAAKASTNAAIAGQIGSFAGSSSGQGFMKTIFGQ
jgi:hypothetical protein